MLYKNMKAMVRSLNSDLNFFNIDFEVFHPD